MNVVNPIDDEALISEIVSQLSPDLVKLLSDIAGVKTDVSGVKTDVSGVKADVATSTQVVANETSEIDAKLESMVTVGGNLDTNVIAINNNTNDALEVIKAEIVRVTSGSLKALLAADVNAARDSINSNVDAERAVVVNAVNTARDSIKNGKDNLALFNEINAERAVIVNAVNAARDLIRNGKDNLEVYNKIISENGLTNTRITNAINAIKAEVIRTTTGSLKALIAADIIAARNNVNSNVDAERVTVVNAVNAARDNIKNGKDNLALFNEINAERAVIVNAVNAARDNVKASSHIKSMQRGRFFTLAISAGETVNIPVSNVNTAKAQLNIVFGDTWSQGFGMYMDLRLTSANQISLTHTGSSGTQALGFNWELIEYV